MRIFIHYRVILNVLLEFGPRQSIGQMNRVWDVFLETSSFELFVSDRGMRRICQELDIYVNSPQSEQVKYEIEKVFRICPLENLQEVRNFTHMYGGSSYEEGIEVYSAFSISADAIFTTFPQDFNTFSLAELPLEYHIGVDVLKSARSSNRLPPLLVGNLSDIRYLQHSRPSGSSSFGSNLGRWFRENYFEQGWQPIEELAIPYQQVAYRKKSVRRGKIILLATDTSSRTCKVALVITVLNPLHESNVVVEVLPTEYAQKLPPALSLQILDRAKRLLEKDTAVDKQSIALAVDGQESEAFSVLIRHHKIVHREDFII